jgi:monoamine oxidase
MTTPDKSDAQTVYDVIVVGAGSAGIAAARTIADEKRSVLVLEAQDHIGGRCRTLNDFPVPYDQGAQFVGQCLSHNTFLYPLMQRRGVDLIRGESLERAFFDPATGKGPLNYDELVETYALVDAALLGAGLAITLGLPDASASDVIKTAGLATSPYLRLVEDFIIRAIDAGDPKYQSTLDLYNNLSTMIAPFNFPPRDTFLIPSGYGTFIASLAEGLPIRTSSPVDSVDYGGDFVTVKSADGGTYAAKTAIVTASINVLKSGSLKLVPELPAAHAEALAGLTMGHAWKAMFEFKGRPFDGHIGIEPGRMANAFALSNEGSPQFFVNYFQEAFPNLPNSYMMTIVEGDPGAELEKMGDQKAGASLCAMLEKPFPGLTASWTGRMLASRWLTNPYTLGCISYATVNNTGGRLVLSKPVANKLFFAGEAMSIHSHSLVNGAWASGANAAYGALFAIGALTERQLVRLRRQISSKAPIL